MTPQRTLAFAPDQSIRQRQPRTDTALDPAITEIHHQFCLLTGMDMPFKRNLHQSDWEHFLRNYNLNDLRIAIGHLRGLYRDKPDIMRSMLRFGYLIRQEDRFDEILAEARARARPQAPATVQAKVGNTRRVIPNPNTVDTSKPVSEILDREQFAQKLKEWRLKQESGALP